MLRFCICMQISVLKDYAGAVVSRKCIHPVGVSKCISQIFRDLMMSRFFFFYSSADPITAGEVVLVVDWWADRVAETLRGQAESNQCHYSLITYLVRVSGNNVWLVCFNCREQFIPVRSKMCWFLFRGDCDVRVSLWKVTRVQSLTLEGRLYSYPLKGKHFFLLNIQAQKWVEFSGKNRQKLLSDWIQCSSPQHNVCIPEV